MAKYTKDSIDRVTEAVDMVGLVSARTDLRRVGSRWTGLCPFHDERTPSFSVDAERKLYNCFGCGEGGDSISFVMATEALGFPEAVELLAERTRVELKREHEDPHEEERRRRRERLLKLLDRAAGYYQSYLWDSSEAGPAREYLAGRGLGEETLRAFRVGYAPKAWDRLLVGAQRDGFSPEELYAAGLVQRGRSGGFYDWFRERITFPVADARGRVRGFGARAMHADQRGKYVNTPENDLFHKGRLLFGIDLAAKAAARVRRVVVCEGYTDVVALHGAGIGEVVAIMGTALTDQQLAELARRVGSEGTVFLALDSDRSGQQAMLRAARAAEERSLALRVIELPQGRDPAELVAEDGSEAFAERLENAVSVLEFAVGRVLAEARLDSPEGKDRAIAQARELIAAAPERSARRDHLIQMVADRADVPVDYVSAAVSAPARPRRTPDEEHAAASGSSSPGAAAQESERVFLSHALAGGPSGRELLERMTPEHLSSELLRRAREHLLQNFGDPLEGLTDEDRELAALVAGIAFRAEEEGRPEESTLRLGYLQLELRRIERQVRNARQDGDFALQGTLAAERQRIRSEMDTAMGQAS